MGPGGESLPFEVAAGRQAYLVDIEGAAEINGALLKPRDTMEIVGESITLRAEDTVHALIIEMEKSV